MAAAVQGADYPSGLDLETALHSVFKASNKQRLIAVGFAPCFEILSTVLLDPLFGEATCGDLFHTPGLTPTLIISIMSKLAELLSLADPCAIYRKSVPGTDPAVTPEVTIVRMLDFYSVFRATSLCLQIVRRVGFEGAIARGTALLMLLFLSAYYGGTGMFASLSHLIFAAMSAQINSIWDYVLEVGAMNVVSCHVFVLARMQTAFAFFWAEMCSEAREHLAMTASYWLHRLGAPGPYDLTDNPSGAQQSNTQERNWHFYDQLQRSRVMNLLEGSSTAEELEEALERTRIPRGSGITARQARARYLTELFFDQTGQEYAVEWGKKSPPDDQQWTSFLTIYGKMGDDSDDEPRRLDIDVLDKEASRLKSAGHNS